MGSRWSTSCIFSAMASAAGSSRRCKALRRVGGALVAASFLLAPMPAAAEFLCEWLYQCYYQSPGFRFRVTDRETGQPLADVHALAEWVQEGSHGRNGPLMVQDAVSGTDGWLKFPAWGPFRGSSVGLVINLDPAITLFKPGYRTRFVQNSDSAPDPETTRVRGFGQEGQTLTLDQFRGSPEEWVTQLSQAVYPPTLGRAAENQILRFREPYLRRRFRVKAELEKLP